MTNNRHNFDYFDHEADIGIIGFGATITEAFISAASAMFAIMGDIEKINPQEKISFNFTESDMEIALVTYLNLLIAKSQAKNLLLGQFELIKNNDNWQASAYGEPWQASFTHGTEVKGATLTALAVIKHNNQWEARCVVDV